MTDTTLSCALYKGRTIKGYIKGVRNIHGPIRFRFKLLHPELRSAYLSDLQQLKGKQADEHTILMLVSSITEWDICYHADDPDTERAGKPVPITKEAMQNDVYSPVIDRMGVIVAGFGESDVDPEDNAADALETLKNQEKTPNEMQALLDKMDEEQTGN